jgi:hypothetical protein
MTFDPFSEIHETAYPPIRDLPGRFGVDSERTSAPYDHWLFRPSNEMSFAQDEPAHESANSLWRTAPRYEMWTSFANLALRLVSSGVSEADTERTFSMQKTWPAFMELDSRSRPWNRG